VETTFAAVSGARFVERRLGCATIVEGSFAAGFQGVRHAHDGHHFLFVIAGCVEDHGLARAERYDSSAVRESPRADRHLLRAAAPSRVILVTLEDAADVVWPRMPSRRRTHGVKGFPGWHALIRALHAQTPDALDLEERVLELFARDSETDSAASPWLSMLRDRLHDEWRTLPPLGTLCQSIGVSREHLARRFRAVYGCTMREYVRRRQLAFVHEGLFNEMPLALLAREAGYADQSHMTRAVTRAFGRSPLRLRRYLSRR